jgi:hypothetical protein
MRMIDYSGQPPSVPPCQGGMTNYAVITPSHDKGRVGEGLVFTCEGDRLKSVPRDK